MYEWHGWATVRASAGTEDDELADAEQSRAIARVRELIVDRGPADNEVADLRAANGDHQLWIAGCHNRAVSDPVDLFRAVAQAAPGSYGILHTYDDEVDPGWTRWVMRRGEADRQDETALNPPVPVLEDPAD